MNAQNVAELAEGLRRAAREHREAAGALTGALRVRLEARAIPKAKSDRLRTADAVLSLLSALDRAGEDALVATLAQAKVRTSDAAMGQSLASASAVTAALDPGEWEVFETLDGLAEPYRERVREIVGTLDDALRHDEHVTPLVPTRRCCQSRAFDLLREFAESRPPVSDPPEPPAPSRPRARPERGSGGEAAGHRTVAAKEVGAVLEEIEKAVRETGAPRVMIEWRVREAGDGPEDEA